MSLPNANFAEGAHKTLQIGAFALTGIRHPLLCCQEGLPFVTSALRGFEKKNSIFVNFTDKAGAEKGIKRGDKIPKFCEC